MTRDELKRIVLHELARLAPEADLSTLDTSTRIREELDLDSFDFVRLVSSFDERLGVEVPESDYSYLETLGGCLDYLHPRVSAKDSN